MWKRANGPGFLDKRAPVVTITGAREYTIDEKVMITCNASDSMTGIVSSPCAEPLVNAPAYQLQGGTNTVMASVEDAVGQIGSASASYTVIVTIPSLINLIRQWSDPNEAGIAQSFQRKLEHGSLDAFEYEVEAQKGKKLTEQQADILIKFVQALK